jgi:hypothetical protein
MRFKIVFLILFLFSFGILHAQTIVTGIVTDSLNVPVPFASVYLSKTTIGNMTNKDGAYTLTIPQNGEYELVTSCIGYQSKKSTLYADGKPRTINIRLSLDFVKIDEVNVLAKDKNRIKNYAKFIKLFLGESVNAENCRILNTEDLYLRKEAESDIITGRSLKPLQIENRSLGYKLTYDLTDFTYDAKFGFLRFSGNTFFQGLPGNAKEVKKFVQHRLRTYYGSRMHFLRSLFMDSLKRENFKISDYEAVMDLDAMENKIEKVQPLPENSLKVMREPDFMTIFSLKPLYINYYDNRRDLSTELIGFEPKECESTLNFSKKIKVFRNGHVTDPYSVTWGGVMAVERVADMMPDDFQPYATTGLKPDSVYAETPVEKYLAFRQKSISSDQVFVQLDRNSYRPGDTIFFQAYVRNRFTGNFESGSVSLYALLFNEKKAMTDSARFRIDNATASGWMPIPEKAETGKYRFTAFTGTMQNDDPAEAFQLDLYVKEPDSHPQKIAVTFDKERYKPGDLVEAIIKMTDPSGNPIGQQKFKSSFSTDKGEIRSEESQTDAKGESIVRITLPETLNEPPALNVSIKQGSGKESMTEKVAVPFEHVRLDLRFLPEGGTFVEGLRQKIGFNATDTQGEPVRIVGLLKDGSGDVLDTIRSGDWGPGSFTCTARHGLSVELIKGGGEQKIWTLPLPASSGLVMSVIPADDNTFAVEIQADSYNGQMVTVTGTMNLTELFSREIILNKKQKFLVDAGQLPSGVAEITLFDKDLKPVAERLFPINSEKHLRFKIQNSNKPDPKTKEAELTITVTDGEGKPAEGFFSVAVTDSVKGLDAGLFTPGIEYTFNYHPNLMSGLPARVLSQGFENLSEDDRDLLLMVYGWTKFKWDFKEMKQEAKQPVKWDLLNIKLLNIAKNQKAGRSFNLVTLEGPTIRQLTSDDTGEIAWPLDSLSGIARMVTLMPDPRDKNKSLEAMMSVPYNKAYFSSDKLLTPQPAIPADEYSVSLPYQYYTLGEKNIDIKEVTVVGHTTPKVYKDKYEEKYQFTNVKSLEPDMLESSTNLETAIRKLVTPYKWTPHANIYLRSPRSFLAGPVPALFVLDGMPIYQNGWGYVEDIPISEVTSITILNGQRGFTQYGDGSQGGVIFINTRGDGSKDAPGSPTKWNSQVRSGNMVKPLQVYRPNMEFYIPVKPEADPDPMLQSRGTIFWDPEVYFSPKEPVRLKFSNLKHTGPVVVTINGVSVNNLIGTGKGRYTIQ